jgi:hypothetical protein
MEQILTNPITLRVSEKAKSVAKQTVIAITVGYLYFGMVAINPMAGLVGFHSLTTFVNMRWANLLRALVLTGPGAAFGIAGGAMAWNVYSGRAALSIAYHTMPFLNIVIGISAYKAYKKWGENYWAGLGIIGVYGLIMGSLVTMNLTSLAMLFQNEAWSKLLLAGAGWKVMVSTLIPMIGYVLLKPIIDGLRSWGEGSSTK